MISPQLLTEMNTRNDLHKTASSFDFPELARGYDYAFLIRDFYVFLRTVDKK